MRISDWSSDVCSSDLGLLGHSRGGAQVALYAAQAGDKLPPALQRIVLVAPGTFDIVHATAEYRTRYGGDFETVRRKAEALVAAGKGDELMTQTDFMYCPKTSVTAATRSEEHTSELQSLMRNSYAVFCSEKK